MFQRFLPVLIVAAAFAYLTGNCIGVALASVVVQFDPAGGANARAVGLFFTWVSVDLGWRILRRSLVGASAAFWTSRLGRFLIGRIAGVAILALLYQPASMAAALCLRLSLSMWFSLGGPITMQGVQLLPWLLYGLTFAFAWICRRPAKIIVGRMSRPARRLLRSLCQGIGGSARFAGLCEEWSHPWKPGRILLGASMCDRKWLVGIEDDRHFCTIATNRSGKGRDAIIGNLLTWP